MTGTEGRGQETVGHGCHGPAGPDHSDQRRGDASQAAEEFTQEEDTCFVRTVGGNCREDFGS